MLIHWAANAQSVYQPNIEGANPVSPTSFQFTKYTELPVSDYTGIPNVSVPLYTIKEDDVTIPIELTYHSVGIRVNQEASWVGLGWDLSFGSIIQNVNDVDDYYNTVNPNQANYQKTKVRPDFSNDVAYPWEYPFAVQYDNQNMPSNPNTEATGYFNPVMAAQQSYGYKVSTDYWFPQNGTYTQNANFFTNHQGQYGNFDSEPDVFTANFLGQSFTFTLDWTNPQTPALIILNKKGYTISRYGTNAWEIQSPQGDQFYFETENSIAGNSSGTGLFGATFSGAVQPSQNIWLLTRIITTKGKTITINYSSAGNVSLFPNYSEVTQYSTLAGSETYGGTGQATYSNLRGYAKSGSPWGVAGGVNPMWGFNTETKYYPSSITFQNGQVTFFTSPTTDQLGGMRLDSMHVTSNMNTLVSSFRFGYSYFPTLNSPGNGWGNVSSFGTAISQRLQLLSITQLDGGIYNFGYDPHPLPPKNSFAQDYWGYYNGQTANTTISPNPAQFNLSSLGNNGDNHSAFLSYGRAGIQTGVQYPTGGSISLLYELNQFNNYWVPDSNSSTNTVSHGNGLRIHSITFLNNGVPLMEQFYKYDVGKSIYPVNMFKNYNVSCLALSADPNAGTDVTEKDYSIWEVSSQGFYSSNPLMGCTGVGYDTVTKTVDSLGTIMGSTVKTFTNNPALGHNIFSGQSLSATLPAIKQVAAENGSVNSAYYYDKNNTLLKQEQYTYTVNCSPIYYGVRMFGYSSLVSQFGVGGGYQLTDEPQNLFGFYPIYDVETLPNSKITTEYAGGGALQTQEGWSYDQNDQLVSHTILTPGYYIQEHIEHPGSPITYYSDAASISLLSNAHRLSDILMSQTVQGPLPYQNQPVSSYYKHYEAVNSEVVESYETINKNLIAPTPMSDTVTFDNYDPTFYNARQVTAQRMRTSILWDYKGVYPVADVKNATINDVAYTSFEADGSGNWTIPSAVRDNRSAVTGNYSYQLGKGSISSAGSLTTGTYYIVSYWSSGSSYSVSGSMGIVTGKTVIFNGNSWTYYEHIVTGVTGVTVSGNGNIDELRLYPKNAQITTYTYAPLVGMTSTCDINNRVTYYLYDPFSRLSVMQDQDGNNIKRYCYTYNGQSTPCTLPTLPVLVPVTATNSSTEAVSMTFTNQTTGASYTFSSAAGNSNTVIGNVPQGNYNLVIGASSPVNSYFINYAVSGSGTALNYANVNFSGITATSSIALTMTPVASVSVNSADGTNQNITISFQSTAYSCQFSAVPGNNGLSGYIPVGTYTVVITPSSPVNTYPILFTVGGSSQTYYATVSFGNNTFSSAVSLSANPVPQIPVNSADEINQNLTETLTNAYGGQFQFTFTPGQVTTNYVPAGTYNILMSNGSPAASYQIDFTANGNSQYYYGPVGFNGVDGSSQLHLTAYPAPTFGIVASNNTTKPVTLQFTNTMSSYVYTFTVPVGASNSQVGTLPEATYNVLMTPNPSNSSQPILWEIYSSSQTYYGPVAFGNVTVASTCTVNIIREY